MIGDRIKKLRKIKGYSLTELADKANVSKSYLSYIERNLQTNPSLQFLTKISNSLGTSVEYLLNGHTKENSEHVLDHEWERILQKAISEGMTKEDFIQFRDYVQFQKWQEHVRDSRLKEE
ncbi:MAG: helix-turn-helix domain-containing protein [Bacillaceae bacterium]|nr:helix-turn-helix domain-containing protein [Bacillaceae bacterium]